MNRAEMKKAIEEAKEKNRKGKQALAKKRLTDNIKKKFSTTIIGSLALMEEYFGELWGLGVDEDKLNNEEIYWRKQWNILRTELLNKGNSQLRAAINEIGEYTLEWEKYTVTFLPVQKRVNLDQDQKEI